jgi:4-alpha-glucanotransferase
MADRPRRSGILLHPSSLPGKHGIGDLGPAARGFLDWLQSAGQRIWQVLPLGVVDFAGCPYASESAFAHEPLLLSLDDLVEDGLLGPVELQGPPGDQVDWTWVRTHKMPLLMQAADRVRGQVDLQQWSLLHPELATWALYRALSDELGQPWPRWPLPLRDREPSELEAARERLRPQIERALALQWLFDRQWGRLRQHAQTRGVELWGDVPIFVGWVCADVWARPHLWRLDADRAPVVVSGVPPDAFSAEGQLWGHPLYDEAAHRQEHFAWWKARLSRALDAVDRVRIDHFRGFQAVWEVQSGAQTAIHGRWIPGPGAELLDALKHAFPSMPFVAEDLGVITDDVRALRDRYDLPGMAILQFAFGGPKDDPSIHRHPYLPHAHRHNQVCYTGTHDNDTLVGWLRTADAWTREHARLYLGLGSDAEIPQALLRAAWRSPCDHAVVPLQDLLGLGSEARMNTPGLTQDNWGWRLASAEPLGGDLAEWLVEETTLSGRRS